VAPTADQRGQSQVQLEQAEGHRTERLGVVDPRMQCQANGHDSTGQGHEHDEWPASPVRHQQTAAAHRGAEQRRISEARVHVHESRLIAGLPVASDPTPHHWSRWPAASAGGRVNLNERRGSHPLGSAFIGRCS